MFSIEKLSFHSSVKVSKQQGSSKYLYHENIKKYRRITQSTIVYNIMFKYLYHFEKSSNITNTVHKIREMIIIDIISTAVFYLLMRNKCVIFREHKT